MPSYAVGLFLATVERTACLGEENAHGFDIQSVVSFCLLGLLAGPASAQDAISKAEQVDGKRLEKLRRRVLSTGCHS
jgi:hypothetical protein